MPQTPTSPGIDPMTFARFMVLPGAVELLQAFAAIPPGRLRETAILHVQALAEAHENAPAQYRAPDPLQALHAAPERPKALPRRTEAEPPTSDQKTRAVQLRLEGKLPYEVAKATGLSVHQVYGATSEARKAGVQFPTTPRAARGLGKNTGVFALTLEDAQASQAPGGLSGAVRAAEARGIDLETYFSRRRTAVEMGVAGRHVRAIMEATKESKTTLSQWFHVARQAGHNIPYIMDAMPAQFEDANVEPVSAEVIDLKPHRKADDPHKGRFILHETEMTGGKGNGGISKGAELMGVSVQEFLRRRRIAMSMFRKGATLADTAAAANISYKQAANWRGRAQRAGVLDLTKIGAERRAKQKA